VAIEEGFKRGEIMKKLFFISGIIILIFLISSTSFGANWTPMDNGLTNTNVSALVINPLTPDTLYAGTIGGGVFVTIDGGANWTAMNNRLANTQNNGNIQVNALFINPQTLHTLYANTGLDVFKSIDGGANWTAVNRPPTTGFYLLAINPQAPDTLYAGTNYGVFKSIDGGANWTIMNTGLNSHQILALALNPQPPITLYAGANFGGVWKFVDLSNISIDPSSINFGNVTVGQSSSQNITITNQASSTRDLTGSIGPLSAPFSIVGTTRGPFILAPGQSLTVTVQFSPSVAGEAFANLSITHNATNQTSPTSILLSGTGVNVINMAVSTTSINFGNVIVGQSSNQNITITNQTSSNTALTENVGTLPAPFSVVSGGGAFNLAPGQSVTVTMQFSPTIAGTASAVLSITHNAANQNNPVLVALSGAGINANAPIISVTPMSNDYGNVKVKRSKTASFVVKNNGKTNLSISSAIIGTDSSMFAIMSGSGSKTIKPGKTLTIKVVFKPASKGLNSATLGIASNDPITPTVDISLSGTGQ
jgi:hypothetical protein